jgi:hypothetical protein
MAINREIRKQATDPRATAFVDEIVWLPGLIMETLADGQVIIEGRTFTNCLLHGPAVFLAVQGVHLDRCNLGHSAGDIRNLLLRPVAPNAVIGAIPFRNCTFTECDFDKIGFTGAEEFIQSLLTVPVESAP